MADGVSQSLFRTLMRSSAISTTLAVTGGATNQDVVIDIASAHHLLTCMEMVLRPPRKGHTPS
jgi:hypothetical protein